MWYCLQLCRRQNQKLNGTVAVLEVCTSARSAALYEENEAPGPQGGDHAGRAEAQRGPYRKSRIEDRQPKLSPVN
jgi:hypothetical protein